MTAWAAGGRRGGGGAVRGGPTDSAGAGPHRPGQGEALCPACRGPLLPGAVAAGQQPQQGWPQSHACSCVLPWQLLLTCNYCFHATTAFMQLPLTCNYCSHATTVLLQQLLSSNYCSHATTSPTQLLLPCNYCSRATTAVMHFCWVACLTDVVYCLMLNEASDSVSL